MCASCGYPAKPACDVDPDCPYHCFGGEHGDTGPQWDHDWYWAGIELDDLGATTTPSHMSRGAELALPAAVEEAAPAFDTIGRRGVGVRRPC